MPLLGLREFEAALVRVSAEADAWGKQTVSAAAAQVEKTAKQNFEGSHRKGEPHTGGDKPNVVSGRLRRSITADPVERYGIGDYGTVVAPRVIYARSVELGNYPGAPKYPYFLPAARDEARKFPDIAAEQWQRFLHV